jgi:hypothetical protein
VNRQLKSTAIADTIIDLLGGAPMKMHKTGRQKVTVARARHAKSSFSGKPNHDILESDT